IDRHTNGLRIGSSLRLTGGGSCGACCGGPCASSPRPPATHRPMPATHANKRTRRKPRLTELSFFELECEKVYNSGCQNLHAAVRRLTSQSRLWAPSALLAARRSTGTP